MNRPPLDSNNRVRIVPGNLRARRAGLSIGTFEQAGSALAAPDAHRHDAKAPFAARHLVGERANQA